MFDNSSAMQTLKQYIASHPEARTHEEWAKFFDVSRSHLTEILNESARPGPRLIQRIHDRTFGKVPPTVWFDVRSRGA